MRQAITLARKHGETSFRMVLGPDRPITEHTRRLKAMRVAGSDADFAEVQIWSSDSGRFAKFEPRKPAKVSTAEYIANPSAKEVAKAK